MCKGLLAHRRMVQMLHNYASPTPLLPFPPLPSSLFPSTASITSMDFQDHPMFVDRSTELCSRLSPICAPSNAPTPNHGRAFLEPSRTLNQPARKKLRWAIELAIHRQSPVPIPDPNHRQIASTPCCSHCVCYGIGLLQRLCRCDQPIERSGGFFSPEFQPTARLWGFSPASSV